jgi:hypothetical protein
MEMNGTFMLHDVERIELVGNDPKTKDVKIFFTNGTVLVLMCFIKEDNNG